MSPAAEIQLRIKTETAEAPRFAFRFEEIQSRCGHQSPSWPLRGQYPLQSTNT